MPSSFIARAVCERRRRGRPVERHSTARTHVRRSLRHHLRVQVRPAGRADRLPAGGQRSPQRRRRRRRRLPH